MKSNISLSNITSINYKEQFKRYRFILRLNKAREGECLISWGSVFQFLAPSVSNGMLKKSSSMGGKMYVC